jgi:hypothetical protein
MVVNQEKVWPALDLEVTSLPDRIYNLRVHMKKGYVSRDDFCSAWPATSQIAGIKLNKLCEDGILVAEKNDRYTAGPQWERFHDK